MEGLIGFAVGFIADLLRSVFLPASTNWIGRFIPSARKKANAEDNILTLSIMEKLISVGKDPSLVKYAREGSERFINVLTSQQDAFVENAVEVIDSAYMAQMEMNIEAGRRTEVAEQQMERAILALERSGWLSNSQENALRKSQKQWEKYALAQAEFASAEFEGGTLAPLAYSSELETATLSRTAELNRMLGEMRERHAD